MGHGDADLGVGGAQGLGGQARPLGAEHQGDPVHAVPGGLVQRRRPLAGGQGEEPEAGRADRGESVEPGVQAGVGHGEDRAHGDLHAAAVERVGAVRGEQDGVHAERRGRPEDGTDVGVVVDRFQDRHPAGRAQHVGRRGQGPAPHGGEGAAVHVVAGDLLGQAGADHVDRCRGVVDDVAHDVGPLRGQQHRPHRVPGVPGAADDLLALGDEQALGGFAPAAQFHVGQAGVVVQARVVGVLDGDEFGHGGCCLVLTGGDADWCGRVGAIRRWPGRP